MIPDLKTVLTLRSLLAVALILWCAGAGCMMVSYARAAANENAGSALMGDKVGGATGMDGHACCKAKHRSQSHDRSTDLQTAHSFSLLLVTSDPLPLSVPLRLPNRAHSYLLDCAFLI